MVEATESMESARVCAVRLLGRWFASRMQVEVELPSGRPYQAFLMNLVYGVMRRQRVLAWAAAHVSDGKPSPKLVPHLMSGLYQILFMDTVADYAAVNETVDAAKPEVGVRAAGYLNAVLRRAATRRGELLGAIRALPPALRESHPDLLFNRWARAFGAARAEALCRWNNEPPETTAHPSALRTDMKEFLAILEEAGIAAVVHPARPESFVVLPRGMPVSRVPGYDSGLFSIQDPATAVAVDMLEVAPGHRVLDACAAPGGKTILIAEQLCDQGLVVAVETQPRRLGLLRENMTRMQLSCVKPVVADATSPGFAERMAEYAPFDRILLDVPCTNTGVLRRKPDARWRFSAGRLTMVNELQRRLLNNVAPLLKSGGIMAYSTCSMEQDENEGIVRAWLAGRGCYSLVGERLLFPPETDTDGAYVAAIRRDAAE